MFPDHLLEVPYVQKDHHYSGILSMRKEKKRVDRKRAHREEQQEEEGNGHDAFDGWRGRAGPA